MPLVESVFPAVHRMFQLSKFRREFETIVTGYYAENVVHQGLPARANKDLTCGLL
jgi:hypothetical protein